MEVYSPFLTIGIRLTHIRLHRSVSILDLRLLCVDRPFVAKPLRPLPEVLSGILSFQLPIRIAPSAYLLLLPLMAGPLYQGPLLFRAKVLLG